MNTRKYITPDDVLNNDLVCFNISVPSHLSLYIRGALGELAYEYNWEQYGAATVEETADFFRELTYSLVALPCDGGNMIGEIKLWPSDVIPNGWMVCDGTTLQASNYPELYSVLGVTYGSSPGGGFRLPDLVGRFVRQVNPNGVVMGLHGGNESIGDEVGSASVGLNGVNTPSHSHLISNIIAKQVQSGVGQLAYVPEAGQISTDIEGDEVAFDIEPAVLCLNYIIKVE